MCNKFVLLLISVIIPMVNHQFPINDDAMNGNVARVTSCIIKMCEDWHGSFERPSI